MLRRQPSSTLFPYTTLFRSVIGGKSGAPVVDAREFAGQVVEIGLREAVGIAGEIEGPAAIAGARFRRVRWRAVRSEEHTSELQSLRHLVCRLLLEKKKQENIIGKRAMRVRAKQSLGGPNTRKRLRHQAQAVNDALSGRDRPSPAHRTTTRGQLNDT